MSNGIHDSQGSTDCLRVSHASGDGVTKSGGASRASNPQSGNSKLSTETIEADLKSFLVCILSGFGALFFLNIKEIHIHGKIFQRHLL